MHRNIQPIVTTIKDRCRVCYKCVRECPAKAIRIANGQAEIITERCIGCGNCVKVCSQKAKKVISSIEAVQTMLNSEAKVVACIAPSFPADFAEMDYKQFVGMIKALGFSYVNEVAFGADLIARSTRELFTHLNGKSYISTACPAVFGYVKRYFPELIDCLAPIVSPMVATARALRKLHGPKIKIVFIGPCIAKKREAYSIEIYGEIDEVLTFTELEQMFEQSSITAESVKACDFDPPYAHKGAVFPIGRGLLEAANIHEDLVDDKIVSACGKADFVDAIVEFSRGEANAKLLDVLCCDGCIMGPGMNTDAPLFRRRALVSQFVRKVTMARLPEEWVYYMEKFKDLDLTRNFLLDEQRIPSPDDKNITEILAKMGKFKPEDELNCGACGYETCREHAVAIYQGFAENEMCLPFTIERLHQIIKELAVSQEKLDSTREALIQSEKMASMGQLSAGIAHEINNPLGVVLMYAHLLLDESEPDSENREDLKMITEHADRAKKIVANLLHFARQHKVKLKPIEIPQLINDCIQSVAVPPNVQVELINELKNPIAELDHEQILQVITNFLNNSIAAMPEGGVLTIASAEYNDHVTISVSDTGTGIPPEIVSKIFDPFFTTKKAGEGTGLGLAIAYGIIKMHRGNVKVKSNTDPETGPTGTTITVSLPRLGVK